MRGSISIRTQTQPRRFTCANSGNFPCCAGSTQLVTVTESILTDAIMATRDKVGYGKPPVHTRWKKGESGNPAGKARGTRNRAPPMRASFNELVEIMRADGRKVGFRNQLAAIRIILTLGHGTA
jgi:hypothetical protein